jgi:hypothetical protein
VGTFDVLIAYPVECGGFAFEEDVCFFFALLVSLRTIKRGRRESKVYVFVRTELLAPLSIFVFLIAFVILAK